VRLAVVGSRDFDDYSKMREVLLPYLAKHGTDLVIVSGGARGADSMAAWFAQESGIEADIYPADWEQFGRGAGYIRNKEIWDNADAGVAFWDGKSKGTAHSFKIAADQNKPIQIILIKE